MSTAPPKPSTAHTKWWVTGFVVIPLVLAALALLAGTALASLVVNGRWIWPHGAHWGGTLVGLIRHGSTPAQAYDVDQQPFVPGPVWTWTFVAVVAGALITGLVHLIKLYNRTLSHPHRMRRQETTRARERAQSAAWATGKDIPQLADNTDPLRWRIGKFDDTTVATPRLESLLVMAPTGSGKTASVVVPIVIELCKARVPKMIPSVKLDVFTLTYAAALESGPVWTYVPSGNAGIPSSKWNPLGDCKTMSGTRTMASWLSRSQKVETRGSDNMRYWDELGKTMLAPMLYAAANHGLSLGKILEWVRYQAETEVENLLTAMLTNRPQDTEDINDALAMWAATCAREARTKSSVYGTAEIILAGFNHPRIRALTCGESTDDDVYTPGKLIDSGGTFYITATETETQDFGAVFDAIMAQLIHEIETRSQANAGLPIPGGFALILEEAANIARVRQLPYVVSAMRGMGLLSMTVWQDEGQIISAYGPETARTIMSNHTWTLYLPGTNDQLTLEAQSKRIGTYLRVDESAGERPGSGSARLVEEAAAPVRDLAQMGPGEAILFGPQIKPVKIRTTAWFNNPDVRRHIPAPIAQMFDNAFGGPK